MRKEGLVPGILYGEGKSPVPIAVEMKALFKLLHSEKGVNTIFELALSGTDRRRTAMVKDFQLDPITDRLTHADFIRIDANKEIHVTVEIDLQGVPAGVKTDGGVLDFTTRAILVACLPKDIPRAIEVDVTGLQLNQSLRVSDLKMPEGVRSLADPHQTVCVVHLPQVEKSPTEVAAETAAADAAATAATAAAADAEAKGKGGKPDDKAKGKPDDKAAKPAAKGDKGKEGKK